MRQLQADPFRHFRVTGEAYLQLADVADLKRMGADPQRDVFIVELQLCNFRVAQLPSVERLAPQNLREVSLQRIVICNSRPSRGVGARLSPR